MDFSELHHVAIIASDYFKAKDFYCNKLGFEVVRNTYRSKREDTKLDLRCGSLVIELFIENDPPARLTHPEACGLRHIAFATKDIEKTVAELNAKGIETEPLRVDPITEKRMTFFRDPDGMPIELHE